MSAKKLTGAQHGFQTFKSAVYYQLVIEHLNNDMQLIDFFNAANNISNNMSMSLANTFGRRGNIHILRYVHTHEHVLYVNTTLS